MYEPCRVCGDLTTEHSNATCNSCGGVFHLALRTDVPAPDCGQVWISEEHLALEFACDTCLAGDAQAPATSASSARLEAAPARRRYTRREGMGASQLARARRQRR